MRLRRSDILLINFAYKHMSTLSHVKTLLYNAVFFQFHYCQVLLYCKIHKSQDLSSSENDLYMLVAFLHDEKSVTSMVAFENGRVFEKNSKFYPPNLQ